MKARGLWKKPEKRSFTRAAPNPDSAFAGTYRAAKVRERWHAGLFQQTPKLCWFALILLSVWAMKRYYAAAGADDLWWILSPTARLAGGAAGVSFAAEPGAGYLSRERLFLIEKSCAGLNFMIAAFAMLMFTFRRRVTSFSWAVIVLTGSLVGAYAAAVVVNATRITIAMWLGAHPLGWSGLSQAQSHRVEGIVVYFAGLVVLHELVLHVQRGAAWVRSTV